MYYVYKALKCFIAFGLLVFSLLGQQGTQQTITLHAPAALGKPGADGSFILDNLNYATPSIFTSIPFIVNGPVTASAYYGDGSNLTGVVTGLASVNVKSMGAVCDGVTSDTVAIQKTIVAVNNTTLGGTVIIPAGCALNFPIVMPRNGGSPAKAVWLRGDGGYGKLIGLSTFPTGRSLIEWDITSTNWPSPTCSGSISTSTCGRVWNQNIKDLVLVPPLVANTGGLHYQVVQAKDTSTHVNSEWWNGVIENVTCEGYNRYTSNCIYIEGNVRMGSLISRITGNSARGVPINYTTPILRLDTCDFAVNDEGLGGDACGAEYGTIISGITGSVMRGGFQQVFIGRLNQATFISGYGNGTTGNPSFHFINSADSIVKNIGNEGLSDNQVRCEHCRNMDFENIFVSSTDDANGCGAGAIDPCGYNDGITLINTIDSRIKNVGRIHGAATFASRGKFQIILDANSHRNLVTNLTSTGPFITEVSIADLATNGVTGYNTAAATEAFDRIGTNITW